jgi:hypothetical protein
MSSREESTAFPGAANGTKSPSNPRDARSDPLCRENIDAQIRWFFDNLPDLERERLHP